MVWAALRRWGVGFARTPTARLEIAQSTRYRESAASAISAATGPGWEAREAWLASR